MSGQPPGLLMLTLYGVYATPAACAAAVLPSTNTGEADEEYMRS